MKTTWIGAQGASEAEVLDALSLERSPDAAPCRWADAEYVMRTFPGGWVVVATWDGLELDEDVRRVAAANPGLTVGCHGNTIVMVSEVMALDAGKPLWSALHDPDNQQEDLQIAGAPPAVLQDLLTKARAEQATADEVDFVYDVPIDVAAALTGFHPNEDDNADWVALRAREGSARAASAGGGFWSGLLRALGLRR